MLKISTSKQVSTRTVDDERDYKLVPRRRAERRSLERRGPANSLQKRHRSVRRIQGLDDIRFTPVRLGERRQEERRKSRPKLLSADEIVILRKS